MLTDWRLFALLAAVFASFTAILGKLGVANVPSNLATLIRTLAVLLFLLIAVLLGRDWIEVRAISQRTWLFLLGSGLCTGLSWACYFRALQLGPVSLVAPIDKLSLAFTIFLALIFLGEPFAWKTVVGAMLMVVGSIVMLL